jgi:ribose 5-phosphate isomerase B
MKIALGSDHAGYEDPPPYYKPEIARYLQSLGHEVVDCGTNSPDSVDYPDFAKSVCENILSGNAERGILICGTGLGIAIGANRFKGIRAAPVCSSDAAVLSRTHNNANVLCLGRRLLSLDECQKLVNVWLNTQFSEGERHVRRIKKLDRNTS